MNKILAGAFAAAAIAAATSAWAEPGATHGQICVWTGSDWACGDGNTFPQHYTEAAGPNVTITPVPSVMPAPPPALPNGEPR
jgi:hypothetical protein